MTVTEKIISQMKAEISLLEASISKWDATTDAAKKELDDLRRAYKALVGEDPPSEQPD